MHKFLQLPSLEKVMPGGLPAGEEYVYASMLRGEEFCYQIAYRSDVRMFFALSVESDLDVSLYDVELIPSAFPAYPNENDAQYISTEPGLFPDLLVPLDNNEIVSRPLARSLWVCVKAGGETPAGRHIVKITLCNEYDGILETKTMELQVIGADLPPQRLIYTQWLHVDCIASYYGVEVFSERHWELIEKFMEMARVHGVNMMLTPIVTPPLDTLIGGERPTIQLVDIKKNGGVYEFGFDRLRRWVALCRKNGIEYYEMAHLFTQWGAYAAPKIVVEEDGAVKRLFGWDTDAASDGYKSFLDQFLPALTKFLQDEGIAAKTYFHISDEPHGPEMLEQYGKVKNIVREHLKEFRIIDALSDFAFYESGAVEFPIPANNAIEPFLNAGIDGLWTYYCCAQSTKVSNRFFAMPSWRNRIIGFQMYKYGIAGFLHWGYNFYYSAYSKRLINPYTTTDADGAFPSGDAFSVYPGAGGPLPSLRLKVFHEALQDMRALELLERYMPKHEIISMLEDLAGMELTFAASPHSPEYILKAREMINAKISWGIKQNEKLGV